MTVLMQRSFAGGEISPALFARTDLVKYATGLRAARNGFIPKTGGFQNRPGTTFVDSLLGNVHKLIEWESADTDLTYILDFTPGRINFYQNGAKVLVSGISAWSIVTPYTVGDLVSSGGVNYYCKAANTGNIPPNATYWHPLIGDHYSIPSPYGATELGVSLWPIQFVQNDTRMTVVNERVVPHDLIRNGHTNWILEKWTLTTDIPPRYGVPETDTPTGLAVSGGPGTGSAYVVTAIDNDTGEESLPQAAVFSATVPSSGTPVTVSWTAVSNARGYNVYRLAFGTPYFVYFVTSNSFIDTGFSTTPDSEQPPASRPELREDTGVMPTVVGLFQQRTVLANFSFERQAIYLSRIGMPRNFTVKFPAADDDAFRRTLRAKRARKIKHVVDVGALVVFADTGEFIARGDNGILTPQSFFPEQYSYNGANELQPLVINSDALYVQAQGSVVRALGFDSLAGGRDGFRDADLTIFSSHLFKNHSIVAWAYQKVPNSIVWAVRDDGILLALTYNKEQQILAWHRHDTDGQVTDVSCVTEGSEQAVYLIVTRNINGTEHRYLERMASRDFSDIRDAIFMDSALSYDGRNTGATTMTLSGGTTWEYDETLTLTASAGFFTAGDVGNKIYLTGPGGDVIRFTIEGYTSPTVVTGKPHATVPVSMRGVATDDWSRAVDGVSGLSHLEGKKVAVFGDGQVVASPNNPAYPEITVTAGAITLPGHFAVVHVGLPYITDLETLDVDSAQGESLIDKQKLVSRVSMHVEDTRGLFVGGRYPSDDSVDPTEGMFEAKVIEEQDDEPTAMKTGVIQVDIESHWNSNGRVLVRQVDPLPMSVLSIAPTGKFPFRG